MKKYKAQKRILHGQLGRIEAGQEFEANDAQIFAVRSFVEVVEESEKSEAVASGSASQAAQASQQTTASESEIGAKRGRKKRGT